MERVLCSWSGGKDSCLALYEIIKKDLYETVALLTVLTKDYDRISMHGVRRQLLELQAVSLGLPLEKAYITKGADNKEYEQSMEASLLKYRDAGVEGVMFGDIFLANLKQYRETQLQKVGMKGVFPLWAKDSRELAHAFIAAGFKAVVTCVDSEKLAGNMAGRLFDLQFLADLPANVDPCGENGEFHTFVYDGPIFKQPIRWEAGETIVRECRFYYTDILPK